MIYQFEHDEIKHCYECPLAETGLDDMNFYYGYCSLSKNIEWSEENGDDDDTPKPDDCPLVAISKTETTSNSCWYCRGIEGHEIVSVKTVVDEFGRELSAYDTPYNFCPNCGKSVKEIGHV